MNMEKPTLVEPGVKYFLKETLKQCKEFKNKYPTAFTDINSISGLLLQT